jgi:hypothetical protein
MNQIPKQINKIFLSILLIICSCNEKTMEEKYIYKCYILKDEGFDQVLLSINQLINNYNNELRDSLLSFSSDSIVSDSCMEKISDKYFKDASTKVGLYLPYEVALKGMLNEHLKAEEKVTANMAFLLLLGNLSLFNTHKLKSDYYVSVSSEDKRKFVKCFNDSTFLLYQGDNDFFMTKILDDDSLSTDIKNCIGSSFRVVLEADVEL